MRHCYVLRVFTEEADQGGNPLGVVPDSTGLTQGDMQEIAADLGFSETVFVSWMSDAPPALRIFTPTMELPFAGHPLVGTAWMLNELGPGAEVMTLKIGQVAISMAGAVCWIEAPETDRPVAPVDLADIASLRVEAKKAWRVRLPMEYLVLELADVDTVVAARPEMDAVAAATDGLYLFCESSPVRSRFFAPQMGVVEDPATGSAAVALAAVRVSTGVPSGSLEIVQGLPAHLSRIHVAWDGHTVRLGGAVVQDEIRLLPI